MRLLNFLKWVTSSVKHQIRCVLRLQCPCSYLKFTFSSTTIVQRGPLSLTPSSPLLLIMVHLSKLIRHCLQIVINNCILNLILLLLFLFSVKHLFFVAETYPGYQIPLTYNALFASSELTSSLLDDLETFKGHLVGILQKVRYL